MENQHRKISGYRELGPTEIDLMNQLKAQEAIVLELIENICQKNRESLTGLALTESIRWQQIAIDEIQSGFMKAVRSIALPNPKK